MDEQIKHDELAYDPINNKLPVWICNDDPIEILNMPSKLEKALVKHAHIHTVGQLMKATKSQLKSARGVGLKAINYVFQIKKTITKKEGILFESKTLFNEFGENCLDSNLVSLLICMAGGTREQEIIKRRYGLLDGERTTLEEISDTYDLTRERVRQIQEKSLKRMRKVSIYVKNRFLAQVNSSLYSNDGIMSENEADNIIPKILGGVHEDGSSLLDLLTDLGFIQSSTIGKDIKIYSPLLKGVSLEKMCRDIYKVIQKEELGLKIEDVLSTLRLVNKVLDENIDTKRMVLKYCSLDPRIYAIQPSVHGNDVLYSHYLYYKSGRIPSKRWVTYIVDVLQNEGAPMHYADITNRVNDMLGINENKLDIRRAHSLLIEAKTFAHTGIHGTYGLTEWGLRRESTLQLITECMRKAGFPLHWKQIYTYVSKYKDSKPISIISMLATNRHFKRIGDGIYSLEITSIQLTD